MEMTQTEQPKNKKRAMLWLSLGTLAMGGLTFLGIKLFTKPKNTTNDDDLKENNDLDVKSTNQNFTKPVVHSALPTVHVTASFPLRLGAKGDTVLRLQRALITSFGAGVFKKYGADGYFGKELESVLKSKGYSVPLSETDFNKITQEKKEVATNSTANQTPPPPLETFNPNAIAKAVSDSITAKDYTTSITLLKGIKNTTDYSLVSEQLKNYRINGVRQTLVNAMLSTFTESSQKLSIQETLKKIGLKYANSKWLI